MTRWLMLSVVAGLFAGDLLAQAEEKADAKTTAPAADAELIRLRQQVEKLTAENAKLRAAKKERGAGTVGRLMADRQEAALKRALKVSDLKVEARNVERLELLAANRLFLGKPELWKGVERRPPAEVETSSVPYIEALASLDAARARLRKPKDDEAALRAVDDMSKALMEVRAELWRRQEAKKKVRDKPTNDKQ